MRIKFVLIVAAVSLVVFVAIRIGQTPPPSVPFPAPVLSHTSTTPDAATPGLETATFGAGCFWCTEAVFQRLKGVQSVLSGYTGGSLKNPSYALVCSGTTGHAEAVQVTFDPAEISYAELLEVFWRTHDPTTLNRQGNDSGTQYRSVIFWHSDVQKKLAEEYKAKIDAAGVFASPVVTEIAPYEVFYVAEGDHQNYYADNARKPYCQFVIRPKLEKLETVFPKKLKAAIE